MAASTFRSWDGSCYGKGRRTSSSRALDHTAVGSGQWAETAYCLLPTADCPLPTALRYGWGAAGRSCAGAPRGVSRGSVSAVRGRLPFPPFCPWHGRSWPAGSESRLGWDPGEWLLSAPQWLFRIASVVCRYCPDPDAQCASQAAVSRLPPTRATLHRTHAGERRCRQDRPWTVREPGRWRTPGERPARHLQI